jgi:hypothetical protein
MRIRIWIQLFSVKINSQNTIPASCIWHVRFYWFLEGFGLVLDSREAPKEEQSTVQFRAYRVATKVLSSTTQPNFDNGFFFLRSCERIKMTGKAIFLLHFIILFSNF